MSDLRQEPDIIPGKLVVGILAAGVAISAVLIVVTWFIADWKSGQRVAGSAEESMQRLAPEEVNEMEVTLFRDPQLGLERHQEAERKLSGYGWEDRERQTVHIPIDRAIELWVTRQRGGGGERQGKGNEPAPPAGGEQR